MKNIITIASLMLISFALNGQDIERLVDSVMARNPAIISLERLTEVSGANARTGLFPSNPEFNIGYFPGKPSETGIKRTWSVTQTIDFPTTYARIKDVKESDLELARLEAKKMVYRLLGEARAEAIEYISLQKKLVVMNNRLADMENLREAYLKLLDLGEATVLDFNRIEMQELATRSLVNEMLENISLVKSRLDYMSGGLGYLAEGTEYPLFPEPDPESVLEEKRMLHPAFLIPAHKIRKAMAEEKLSKTGNLPGFNIGYASESVASETFTGPQLGFTIPLWGNSGKVDAARAARIYEESAAYAEIASLESKLISGINSFVALKSNLEMVNSGISSSEARQLLKRALDSGEITLTDYLIEIREYYHIEDILMDFQRRYCLQLSEIWDYKFGDITF